VSGSDRSAERPPKGVVQATGDETPISSSGVMVRAEASPAPASRRKKGSGDSEPPSAWLTPYQARLDVEMDDTAVSKVRDPSVSLLLGAGDAITSKPPPRPAPVSRLDAIRSVAVGTLLGALLVVTVVAVARWLAR
jgi:hypothetical protein